MSALRVNYPNKRFLSDSEQARLLQSGPELSYFKGWAEQAVAIPSGERGTPFRCGLVHICKVTKESELRVFYDREGLAWALEGLYTRGKHRDCTVWYFTPDEPIRLRLKIEWDPEEDDSEDAE